MKTILVPIDFSIYSQNALVLAVYIAKTKGMQIKLLHIMEESNISIPFLNRSSEEDTTEAERVCLDHMNELISPADHKVLNFIKEVRKSSKGIVKEIINEKCDLIVMGRRNADNNTVFFFGTTAEKVVRLSDVPVITVGELRENFSFQNIVFASDFEEVEQKPIVQRVITFADIFKAKIDFLYVALNREFINGDKIKETIEENASNFDLKGNDVELYVADTRINGISQYIQDSGADLLALCTHGKTGITSFLTESVAENLSAFAPIPVLTYNLSKDKIERVLRPVTREKIILRKKTGKNI